MKGSIESDGAESDSGSSVDEDVVRLHQIASMIHQNQVIISEMEKEKPHVSTEGKTLYLNPMLAKALQQHADTTTPPKGNVSRSVSSRSPTKLNVSSGITQISLSPSSVTRNTIISDQQIGHFPSPEFQQSQSLSYSLPRPSLPLVAPISPLSSSGLLSNMTGPLSESDSLSPSPLRNGLSPLTQKEDTKKSKNSLPTVVVSIAGGAVDGKSIVLEDCETVRDVQTALVCLKNVAVADQRLSFQGQLISPNATISNLCTASKEFSKDGIVHLMLSSPVVTSRSDSSYDADYAASKLLPPSQSEARNSQFFCSSSPSFNYMSSTSTSLKNNSSTPSRGRGSSSASQLNTTSRQSKSFADNEGSTTSGECAPTTGRASFLQPNSNALLPGAPRISPVTRLSATFPLPLDPSVHDRMHMSGYTPASTSLAPEDQPTLPQAASNRAWDPTKPSPSNTLQRERAASEAASIPRLSTATTNNSKHTTASADPSKSGSSPPFPNVQNVTSEPSESGVVEFSTLTHRVPKKKNRGNRPELHDMVDSWFDGAKPYIRKNWLQQVSGIVHPEIGEPIYCCANLESPSLRLFQLGTTGKELDSIVFPCVETIATDEDAVVIGGGGYVVCHVIAYDKTGVRWKPDSLKWAVTSPRFETLAAGDGSLVMGTAAGPLYIGKTLDDPNSREERMLKKSNAPKPPWKMISIGGTKTEQYCVGFDSGNSIYLWHGVGSTQVGNCFGVQTFDNTNPLPGLPKGDLTYTCVSGAIVSTKHVINDESETKTSVQHWLVKDGTPVFVSIHQPHEVAIHLFEDHLFIIDSSNLRVIPLADKNSKPWGHWTVPAGVGDPVKLLVAGTKAMVSVHTKGVVEWKPSSEGTRCSVS
eukprot:TRINITY_DN9204_c0_g3_i1.p1 TRINITY_DN9204_c0_g3~~TRINITY_DN9204_c0_g3_i1.p1  ORF type:complete len:891 (+),score=122.58 TRINITY_DN9204_c0_g3_i1:64-2673(+)